MIDRKLPWGDDAEPAPVKRRKRRAPSEVAALVREIKRLEAPDPMRLLRVAKSRWPEPGRAEAFTALAYLGVAETELSRLLAVVDLPRRLRYRVVEAFNLVSVAAGVARVYGLEDDVDEAPTR